MITQGFLNWWADFLASTVGVLLPELPGDMGIVMQDLPASWATVVGGVAKLSPVLPFTQMGMGLNLVLAAMALAVIIRSALKILSLASGGGGSA